MAGRRDKSGYRKLSISIVLSAAILWAGTWLVEGLSFQKASLRLLASLARLMGTIGIGLVAGQIIEATGWTRFLSILARPLFRFANLGNRCSVAFTAAFVSGTASNAMLSGFHKDGKITRAELFLTNLINQFPGFFVHLPTTFFIIVPLTGRAGLLYFAITLAAAVFRTVLCIIYGHLRFPENRTDDLDAETAPDSGKNPKKSILRAFREKLPGRLAGIATYVVPIYILVFLLNAGGVFEILRNGLAAFATGTILPVESLSVVVLGFTAEFASGFAAAGALMEAGVLTLKQTVLALVIGNIIAFPIRAVRHQLPHYMGIFSPALGTQLLLAGQAFRVASIVATAAVFYFLG